MPALYRVQNDFADANKVSSTHQDNSKAHSMQPRVRQGLQGSQELQGSMHNTAETGCDKDGVPGLHLAWQQ